jgi:Taurine catabolism dioxygenase TauD, TfdA family
VKTRVHLITPHENKQINSLCDYIFGEDAEVTESRFQRYFLNLSEEMPLTLRQLLSSFRREQNWDMLIFKGLRVKDSGATPRNHMSRLGKPLTSLEVAFGLLTHRLGDVYGYNTQQSGRLFNDIIPVLEGPSVSNSSAGFTDEFKLHTEDAFLFHAPDYICWACHRNSEKAGTLLSSIPPNAFDDSSLDLLREPLFSFAPNALQKTAKELKNAPIIWGSRDRPMFRINSNQTAQRSTESKVHYDAYNQFVERLRREAETLVFSPDELIILDNRRVAHGRLPYTPHQSSPRWLSRVVVKRDINVLADQVLADNRFVVDAIS